ncbi:MAG: YybS family protein [Treponema sp.]|nr:YybS family protein [Treponema sp.]
MPAKGWGLPLKAVACAALCILMMNLGTLALFFLVPLGFSAVAFGPSVAWLAFAIITGGNVLLTLFFSLQGADGGIVMGILYFSMTAGFTWVMAGNPPLGFMPGKKRILPEPRTLYRFVCAISAMAMSLSGMLLWFGRDGYSELALWIEPQLNGLVGLLSGGDATMRSYTEGSLSAEQLIRDAVSITVRGGAILSSAMLLFFNRQLAFGLARLFRLRAAGSPRLADFFAPPVTILCLTVSLPALLVGRSVGMLTLEVVAWNVIVVCGIVFLAQGGGIAMYNLARRRLPPLARFLIGLLFLVSLFTPGLNLLALAVLLILGIAENWLPLRRVRVEPLPK